MLAAMPSGKEGPRTMSISDSEQYDLLERLAAEFAARLRRGERPPLEEYTDRYPGWPRRFASSSRR